MPRVGPFLLAGSLLLGLVAVAPPAQAGTSCVVTYADGDCTFSCDPGDFIWVELHNADTGPGPAPATITGTCGGTTASCSAGGSSTPPGTTSSSCTDGEGPVLTTDANGVCTLTLGDATDYDIWGRCSASVASPDYCDGAIVSIDGVAYVVISDGPVVQVWLESNGKSGLQCDASNPDTRVV